MAGRPRVLLGIRLLLAAAFAIYGVAKFTGAQFAVGPGVGEMRAVNMKPWLVTWYFFSLSPAYCYAIGATQVGIAVLLVARRTAAVGALCFLVVITNIVLVNFCYDIATDVKVLSSVLLVLDCVLLWHYRHRYALLLLSDAAVDAIRQSGLGSRARGA